MDRRQNKATLATNNKQREPGSNWERFKNLLSNPKPDRSSKKNSLQISIKKHSKFKEMPSDRALVIQNNSVTKNKATKTLTKQVAIDCEMVGIGNGVDSMIARVSIVNKHGECVYDKYVKPREKIVDYRTPVSGIQPHHLENAEEFIVVQKEVAEILRGRVLIGHALKHDLDVLYLSHPRRYIRDTSRYKPFRQITKGSTPSLKRLAHELLGREIQVGEHNSVEDAKAAMQLYMLYKNKWESEKRGH